MRATNLKEVFQGLGKEIIDHLFVMPGPSCVNCGTEIQQNFWPVYKCDGGLVNHYILYLYEEEGEAIRILPVEFTPSLVLSDPAGFRGWLLERLKQLPSRGKVIKMDYDDMGRALGYDTFDASATGSGSQTGMPVNAGRL